MHPSELLPQDMGYRKANMGSRTCVWWRHLCALLPAQNQQAGPCRLEAIGELMGQTGVLPCP